jgi:hypothetical protein
MANMANRVLGGRGAVGMATRIVQPLSQRGTLALRDEIADGRSKCDCAGGQLRRTELG